MLPRLGSARLCVGLFVLLCAGILAAGEARAIDPQDDLFVFDNYAPSAGLVTPTCMAFFPDGRLLVGEKRGRVWLIQNGVKSSPAVLQIDNEVLDDDDRGMLGLAIDPNFATNRHIYVLYTVDPDTNGVDDNLVAFSRLTRYTLDAANVAIPSSRTILIGVNWAAGVPIGSPSHTIGSLRWGQDGSLLVSCGDGADFNAMDPGGRYPALFQSGRTDPYEDIGAFRAQSLSSLAGKVLRINPATGGGYPSNPYWDGNAFSKRSRVWVYGLRNPFRIQVRPNTGATDPAAGDPGSIYLGDVGWSTWEEISVAPQGGMNFGWPCWEGRFTVTAYQNATPAHNGCNSVGTPDNPTSPTLPPIAWNHGNPATGTPPGFTGNAAVSGVFYTGTQYPGQYRNALFLADYGARWIRVGTFDANDQFLSLSLFATDCDGPVDFATDPVSGDVFFIALSTNRIHRIRYTGTASNTAPVVSLSATPELGTAPLTVQFSSAGTMDPDGDAFTLAWDFGDGQGSSAANPQHTYPLPGSYTVRLTADDHKGGVTSRTMVISATGPNAFPTTAVLDNFNRADGPIGGSWAGTTTGLVIVGQQLGQTSVAAAPVWNGTGAVFGATQEAFVTLNTITTGNTEHDLMLKVQGTSWDTGHIEVRYDASPGAVTVSTYHPTQGWVTRGGPYVVTFVPGDRFGARAYPNGTVEVYRNGSLIGTASAAGWPFAASAGRIGMTLVGAALSRLDGFGGGDAVLDPNTKPTATITSPANGSFYHAGQNLALSGTKSDAQDPPDSLTARWEVDVHHNNHVHPNSKLFTGLNATLVGENHDDGTGVHYGIRFIVTDKGGKSDTARVDIWPEMDVTPSPITVTPDPPASNASSTLRVAFRNLGRMPTSIHRWAVTLDGAAFAQGDTAIGAQDSVVIVRTLPPLGAGNHVLRARADSLGQLLETSEINNAVARTVTPIDLSPLSFVQGPTATPGTSSAVVSWTSNETARGAVRYGLTAALGDSVTTPPGTSGSATLPGLTRGTTYHVRVAITDVTNLTTLSAPATFATLANRAPVASASGSPLAGPPPLTVQFSSAGSSDADGDPLTYRWTFGDGDSSALANPSHVYATAGAYVATLRVSDAFGGSDQRSIAITVGGAFPALPVLDNFNRVDGSLAAPWSHQLTGMRIQGNRLVQQTSGWNSILWNGATFGADQECYVTLSALTAGSPENDVLLKVQGATTPTGILEVRYDHQVSRVFVASWTPATGWRTHGSVAQTYVAGDRLGARALANGTVEVYRNTTRILSVSATAYPFYNLGGRIGLTVALATASAYDDFGGGTLASGPDLTPPVFVTGPTATPQTQSATVAWTTNEATTGVVRYGLTSTPTDSVATPLGASHTATLPNLSRGTQYVYSVTARDVAGNARISSAASLTTLPNRVPIANANGSPTTGTAPLTVTFSSAGSSDPDGDPLSYAWAFGDGTSSTATGPSNTYAAPGTYSCVLTVSDGFGGIGRDTVVVTVTNTPSNRAPVANATASPTNGTAPLTVAFSSTGSSDPDGDPITFTWAFGDGNSSTAAGPSNTYAAAGTYPCVLTVSDNRGGIGRDTVVVTVAPPAAGFPTTPVVDDFNRVNGAPGASWAGDVTRAGVSGNALALIQNDASMVYSAATYGATQEAYMTLNSVSGIGERDLMLKVQGLSWSTGHIEVRYSPGQVSVATYAPSGGWVTHGVFNVTMAAGDRLGGRANAAGQVQVYRNATLLGTTTVTGWPFAASGGRIGMTLAGGIAATIDNFGGGTVPGTEPSAPALAGGAPGMDLEGIPHDMAWLSPARPNPSPRSVAFTLSLPTPMAVTWSVVDLQGRHVWEESRSMPGGLTTLTWDGTAGGRRAPAGVYLAVVDLDGRRLTRRFIRVE